VSVRNGKQTHGFGCLSEHGHEALQRGCWRDQLDNGTQPRRLHGQQDAVAVAAHTLDPGDGAQSSGAVVAVIKASSPWCERRQILFARQSGCGLACLFVCLFVVTLGDDAHNLPFPLSSATTMLLLSSTTMALKQHLSAKVCVTVVSPCFSCNSHNISVCA
jgi:hypothetical protein